VNWKKKLEDVLRASMKYCFRLPDDTYPEMLDEEFYGEDSDGFLAFMISVVRDMRRRAYQDGFKSGYFMFYEGKPSETQVVGTDLDAERSWMHYEKSEQS
jgi:hypothetical protein